MSQDRKCRKCGGLDEFIYEINWRPVFYCAECDRQSDSEGKELAGPDEKLKEETGEEPPGFSDSFCFRFVLKLSTEK